MEKENNKNKNCELYNNNNIDVKKRRRNQFFNTSEICCPVYFFMLSRCSMYVVNIPSSLFIQALELEFIKKETPTKAL